MSRNIKEIGKELMGKSLNSYHRKTGLTQLEKNNEMQDGILNGILSQVDDAYIEKIEQSNVIHLDGSGDGAVVLDGIEGNTMVNLFSTVKESSIVTSYGNHNGFHLTVKTPSSWTSAYFNNIIKKPNTTYTYVVYVDDLVGNAQLRSHLNTTSNIFNNVYLQEGLNIHTFTTNANVDGNFYGDYIGYTPTDCLEGNYVKVSYIILLEGDWTNKEIPPYFEGLQSSFEENREDDKYKIEILSNSENILNMSFKSVVNATCTNNKGVYTITPTDTTTNQAMVFNTYIPKGTYYYKGIGSSATQFRDINNTIVANCGQRKEYQIVLDRDVYNITYNWRSTGTTNGFTFDTTTEMVTKNQITKFVPHKQNKIKLLINEPLRGIGDIKDRFVFKDGKLMIERNCAEVVLNGDKYWTTVSSDTNFYKYMSDAFLDGMGIVHRKGICDKLKLKQGNADVLTEPNILSLHTSSNYSQWLYISSNLSTLDEFRLWLSNNPVTLVYQLIEPTYEEIPFELQKIILGGYENGTLYVDSTIIPTTTVRYTPKMESFNTIKEVSSNNVMLTTDINDTIIPYMMEVDLMIMEKEMSLFNSLNKNIRTMEVLDMTSMQKRTGEMLERLIKGKTLTEKECKTRVTVYLNAGKITDEQAEELMLLISEIYA